MARESVKIYRVFWHIDDDYGPMKWVEALICSESTNKEQIIQEAFSALDSSLKDIAKTLKRADVDDITNEKMLRQSSGNYF